MEATRINRPPEDDPGSAANNQVHRFAPTLMGGETPGSQGTVRVWSPNVWLLRGVVAVGIGAFIHVVGMLLETRAELSLPFGMSGRFDPRSYYIIDVLLLLAGLNFVPISRLMRRPKCVTTDDAGIAIITRKGSRAFLWTEIIECARRGGSLVLKTDHDRVVAPLPGYLPAEIHDLLATVAQRSNLYRDGRRYVRPERIPAGNREQPALKSNAIRSRRAGVAFFVASAVMGLLIALAPFVFAGILFKLGREVRAEFYFPSAMRDRGIDTTLSALNEKIDGVKDHSRKHAHSSAARKAAVVLFVPQSRGQALAVASVPGFICVGGWAGLAVVDYATAHASTYEYVIFFRSKSRILPKRFMVRLQYPSYSRWVEATLSSNDFTHRPGEIPYYSNNWGDNPAPGLDQGPLLHSLPPLRLWSFAALSVARANSHAGVRDFSFEPPPARQHTLLDAPHPRASAAWLPGSVPASGVWCTIRYSDGASQRVRVDKGAVPPGIRRLWGLSPQERAKLPAGRA